MSPGLSSAINGHCIPHHDIQDHSLIIWPFQAICNVHSCLFFLLCFAFFLECLILLLCLSTLTCSLRTEGLLSTGIMHAFDWSIVRCPVLIWNQSRCNLSVLPLSWNSVSLRKGSMPGIPLLFLKSCTQQFYMLSVSLI